MTNGDTFEIVLTRFNPSLLVSELDPLLCSGALISNFWIAFVPSDSPSRSILTALLKLPLTEILGFLGLYISWMYVCGAQWFKTSQTLIIV